MKSISTVLMAWSYKRISETTVFPPPRPDMPAGVVSLTLYTDQSSVSLRPVTYYTNMGEVSRYLESATDPVNFICQVRHYCHIVNGVVERFAHFKCSPGYSMWVILYFQAFNLMSNATESLDSMLTDSLKSRMPATSFQLFGVRQIEEDNMAACEYSSGFFFYYVAKADSLPPPRR